MLWSNFCKNLQWFERKTPIFSPNIPAKILLKIYDIGLRWVCGKIAQNVAQHTFCQNWCITWIGEKTYPKMWATCVFSKNCPK
jgi:hypothetical protein